MTEEVSEAVTVVESNESVRAVSQEVEVRTVTVGEQGPAGPQGEQGVPGASASIFHYKAKANVSSGNPADSYLLWDNATQISAANIHISHEDQDGNDLDNILALIASGTKLLVQDRDLHTNNQLWEVSGTPILVEETHNYWIFPVTLISSAGTGSTGFANNHNLLVFVVREGQAGPQGPAGADGADGSDGREVEIQNSGTYIQWRYVGDVSWTNLVALSAITGATGPAGADGIGTAQSVGDLVNTLTAKATPADNDMIGLMDSAASNIWKKLSWSSIKAALKSYFDGFYAKGVGGTYTTISGTSNYTAAITDNGGGFIRNTSSSTSFVIDGSLSWPANAKMCIGNTGSGTVSIVFNNGFTGLGALTVAQNRWKTITRDAATNTWYCDFGLL